MSTTPSTTPTKSPVFLGVQMTPKAACIAAVTDDGNILTEVTSPYATAQLPNPKGIFEQDPNVWWEAVRLGIGHTLGKLRQCVASSSQLKAISVCGQPGDLVILDRSLRVFRPAILAVDARAADQIIPLNRLGKEHRTKLGLTFQPTDPLAKMVWIKEHEPDLYDNAVFCHQVDYIVMMLTSLPPVTEYSLAALTGCDSIAEAWPDWIDYDMHLGVRERLPVLRPQGTPVGNVSKAASAACGLPLSMQVVLGTTSSTAGFLSSGARKVGDCYTSLDENMTIHGISTHMVPHPQVFASRLPGRRWYYSTKCVAGAAWMNAWFDEETRKNIMPQAEASLPTEYIAYPNVTGGETFPFNSSTAEGFITPATDNHIVQFAACLQGTALFERLCYRKLQKLMELSSNGDVYAGGPWNRYDFWMQCRADILSRTLRRMHATNGVTFGAAMLAAAGSHFPDLEKTSQTMVRIDKSFYPDSEKQEAYNECFQTFLEMMEQQGYA